MVQLTFLAQAPQQALEALLLLPWALVSPPLLHWSHHQSRLEGAYLLWLAAHTLQDCYKQTMFSLKCVFVASQDGIKYSCKQNSGAPSDSFF